jgi:hypothetical protein
LEQQIPSGGDTCSMFCDTGFLDCDGLEDDGCETFAKATPPHMFGDACRFTCDLGFADCNHSQLDGCEHAGACPDTGVDADSGPACAPATSLDEGGTPAWTAPAAPSNACSAPDIAGFWQAFSSSDSTALDAWTQAHPACAACLVTKSTAPSLGPLIDDGYLLDANVGGCVALLSGDATATGCGARQLEADQCPNLVCAHCQSADFFDCTDAAPKQEPCSAYDFVLCDQPDAGAIYDTCFSETTFDEYVTKLGALFCSNGSSDASTD